MDIMFQCLIAYLVSYFAGNLSLSYYWLRLSQHRDLRKLGSGSLGARNTSRYLGKKGFILTLLFDMGKGALAIYISSLLINEPMLVYPAAIFVIAGHIWPALLGFKGGKGIATALGAFIVIDPRMIIIVATLSLFFYVFTRNFTESGLFGFALLPPAMLVFNFSPMVSLIVAACCILILWAHRENIKEELVIFKE